MTYPTPNWKLTLENRVGRTPEETALLELDELEGELKRMLQTCARLRMFVNKNGATPVGQVGQLYQQFVALDGWAISIVESYFTLTRLLISRERQWDVMLRWRGELQRLTRTS